MHWKDVWGWFGMPPVPIEFGMVLCGSCVKRHHNRVVFHKCDCFHFGLSATCGCSWSSLQTLPGFLHLWSSKQWYMLNLISTKECIPPWLCRSFHGCNKFTLTGVGTYGEDAVHYECRDLWCAKPSNWNKTLIWPAFAKWLIMLYFT